MAKRLWIGMAATALGLMASAGEPQGTAGVMGLVTWEGALPERRKLEVNKDNEKCECDAKDPSKRTPFKLDESLVVDGGTKGVAHCVVWLKGATGGPVRGGVEIDQRGCQFIPHVAAVTLGQKVKVLNPDGIAHNYHWYSKINEAGNVTIPKFKKAVEVPEGGFAKPEFIRVTCDIHAWMGGWIAVMENGYVGVTDAQGQFRIEGVPPGKYTLACWHEPLSPEGQPLLVTKEISVEAGKAASADFTLKTP